MIGKIQCLPQGDVMLPTKQERRKWRKSRVSEWRPELKCILTRAQPCCVLQTPATWDSWQRCYPSRSGRALPRTFSEYECLGVVDQCVRRLAIAASHAGCLQLKTTSHRDFLQRIPVSFPWAVPKAPWFQVMVVAEEEHHLIPASLCLAQSFDHSLNTSSGAKPRGKKRKNL